METYRISSEKYAFSLSSSGKANRWNKDGESVIYVGSSRSLSTLELVVHRKSIKPLIPYKVMSISLAEEDPYYEHVRLTSLPKKWREESAYSECQDLGSEWYHSKRSLFLKVPSAIIPQEFNYIINLSHPDYSDKTVSLIRSDDYFWDDRLLPT